MSQNGPYPGPPWSSGGGGSDDAYLEPADPWGDQSATPPPPDPHWGGQSPSIPQQPVAYHTPAPGSGSAWNRPGPTAVPPPSSRRNTPMIALVVTLGLLIVVGLGATLWLLKARNNTTPVSSSATSAAADPAVVPRDSEDARFNVKKGDCVVNEGTDVRPEMRATPCTSGTYVVLARIEGRTTGEKDAEKKCAKVSGYTKWYFYDSQLDDLDFVLCLKEHKSL